MSILDSKVPGFKQTWREFLSRKSNWTGISMIITGGVALFKGASIEASIGLIFGGFSLLFVRDGIAGN